MANVALEAVRKVYSNGAEAVTPSSFDINDGEFLVLVGPSGCGKSTILRMVAGLEEITEGTLRIGERVVNGIDPADRDIAMVFQNYALYPHMTVRKNIAYGLKTRRVPADEIAKKVDDVARMLNLSDYLERKPSQLSGGQRQRVAMGRAIVRDPALFLFDEPLSNLDAKLRNQMRIEIKALQRRLGVTSIYVTHDQVEAMTMADRIVVLNTGRIEQIGTPSEIYNRPASTFVAAFMGAPPMNLLDGEVRGGKVMVGEMAVKDAPAGLADGKVIVGIRPEDLVPDPQGRMALTVDIVEELGAHKVLHAKLNGQPLLIGAGKDVSVGRGLLQVSFPVSAISLFDAASGQRI
ncbi:ABC transporter ATP-binding protein [Pseudoruegeria sp. HB172150]|uniref:ABC transporter ATP-binding protein n=1 Tax=Pseudoruegeria sp. HB172150 TaxID=2721164 RepID=UPI001551C6C8|nr:sn-glycerol-3-phosphate ABC transporter ATP-binding protein UgpC [Pseudoruegeria sp. HB172150]